MLLVQHSMHSSTKKLATIQHKAALMITGAMGSTANDVIDSMANLLPFHLLVEHYRYRAALRLATLPTSHPLAKPVDNATKMLVKRHPTPLHCREDSRALLTRAELLCSLADANNAAALAQWYKW